MILVEPRTPWKHDVAELVLRNTHGVDRSVISSRVGEWQDVHPNYYGWFLNPADTDQLLEFGNSWLEKCISVKVSYRILDNNLTVFLSGIL